MNKYQQIYHTFLECYINQDSLVNCVPYMLMFQCSDVLTCLACSCAHVPCMLMRLACLRAHMPMCLACSRALHTFQCSLDNVPCIPMCSHAITMNDKDKFSITCFPYILWLFFDFLLWNKIVAYSWISLTSQKSLTGAMTNFVQWNS